MIDCSSGVLEQDASSSPPTDGTREVGASCSGHIDRLTEAGSLRSVLLSVLPDFLGISRDPRAGIWMTSRYYSRRS